MKEFSRKHIHIILCTLSAGFILCGLVMLIQDFYNTGDVTINNLQEVANAYAAGILATLEPSFNGKVTIRNSAVKNGKVLLVIKDSYANSMVPYLLDHYEKITMIDLRYYNESVPSLVAEGWDEVLVCYEMTNFIKDRNLFKLIV